MIVALRVYVAVFAVGVLVPATILPMLGPQCVALWLCRRVATSSIPPGQAEARS